MRGKSIVSTAVASAALIAGGIAAPLAAHAEPIPATGAFSFTTGPGILSTWAYNNLRVTTTLPTVSVSRNNGTQITSVFPVVAKEKTANFTGGQIRITNTKTNDFINCLNPAVDMAVKVVD